MSKDKNHKIFFAPWRKRYYHSSTKKESKDSKKCIFCNKEKELLILQSKYCFIQANKYPYAGGHLMVIPNRHVNSITELTTKERMDLFNLLDLATYSLKIYKQPDGYNIGCSVGKIAGESIHHLHFHIVPRFKGDVGWNLICDFNIISVSPEQVTKDIRKVIKKNKLKKKFDIL